MADLTKPTAGGRIRITPRPTGDYWVSTLPLDDPLEGASEEQRQYYLAHYAGIPLADLLCRLRVAEWDAAYRQERIEQLEEYARRMPPLHLIEEMDERHKRLRALLDKPGRISKTDLLAALSTPSATTDEA